MGYLDHIAEQEVKMNLLQTLRTITDGKIFVEVERARLTRILAKIREQEGKVAEAAEILQEVQVSGSATPLYSSSLASLPSSFFLCPAPPFFFANTRILVRVFSSLCHFIG